MAQPHRDCHNFHAPLQVAEIQQLHAAGLPMTITCPDCTRTSHNANDVLEGWCGRCLLPADAAALARPMSELLAAKRDASFYDKPGRAEQYHVVIDDKCNVAACSPPKTWRSARMMLAEFTARPAVDVPDIARCQRPGCKQRWP
jgi:hypothetical protein